MTEITSPSKIGRQGAVLELPEEQNDVKIVVRVRALSFDEIVQAEGGVPMLPTDGDVAIDVESLVKRWRAIASFGLVEPKFTFGEEHEDGVPSWDDLLFANQKAVVMKIYEMSGRGSWAEGGPAKRLATFPAPDARGTARGRKNHPPR